MVQAQIATPNVSNVSKEVVKKVAEAEDVDPLELTLPLSAVIDPDALESLFANNQAVGKVVFNYDNHEVSVFADGYVSVESHGP